MAVQANVSAEFDNLSAAEEAIAALLRIGLRGPDVVLTRGGKGTSYVVTAAANQRVSQVEDILRRHAPIQWRATIHDHDDVASGEMGSWPDLAPEADRLEQTLPWLAEVTEAAPRRVPDTSSEADWIEQLQARP